MFLFIKNDVSSKGVDNDDIFLPWVNFGPTQQKNNTQTSKMCKKAMLEWIMQLKHDRVTTRRTTITSLVVWAVDDIDERKKHQVCIQWE